MISIPGSNIIIYFIYALILSINKMKKKELSRYLISESKRGIMWLMTLQWYSTIMLERKLYGHIWVIQIYGASHFRLVAYWVLWIWMNKDSKHLETSVSNIWKNSTHWLDSRTLKKYTLNVIAWKKCHLKWEIKL